MFLGTLYQPTKTKFNLRLMRNKSCLELANFHHIKCNFLGSSWHLLQGSLHSRLQAQLWVSHRVDLLCSLTSTELHLFLHTEALLLP